MDSRRRWADAESEEEEEPDSSEKVITSIPNLGQTETQPVPQKKKRSKPKQEEDKPDPNVTTKLNPKKETPVDQLNLSKKEKKQKEMQELDAILNEFGLEPQAEGTSKEEVKSNQFAKQKAKTSDKKQIFQSVREEINARQSKKKKKDKNKFPK